MRTSPRGLNLHTILIITFLLLLVTGPGVLVDGKGSTNCDRNFTKVYKKHKERVSLLSTFAEKKNIEAKQEFINLLGYLDDVAKSGGAGIIGIINQGKMTVDFLWDFNDFLWGTMEFWGEAIAIIDPYSELYKNYDDLNIATPNSPLNAPTLMTSLFNKAESSLNRAIEASSSSQQDKTEELKQAKNTISTVLDAVEEQGSFRQTPADLQMVFRHMESLADNGGQSSPSLENPFGAPSSGGSSGRSRKERLRILRAYMQDFAVLLKEMKSDLDSHIECIRGH